MKKHIRKALNKQTQAKKVKQDIKKLERIALKFDATIDQEADDLSYYQTLANENALEHNMGGISEFFR